MAVTPPSDAPAPVLPATAPAPGTVLSRHYDGCFACGDAESAGLHMKAVVGEGASVQCTFTVTRSHQGAPMLAHGGLLATAIDESMGFVHFLIGEPAVTAHLEIDYRRPVPVGSVVTIDAACQARQGRKVWTTATGRLEDGKVAFSGAALFLTVPVEHFTSRLEHVPDAGERILGRYNP